MLAGGNGKVRSETIERKTDPQDCSDGGAAACDEWKSYLDRTFTLADRNHDGNLDPSEFASVRKPGSPFADADFGYFDENQDGRITRKEFVNKPSEFILNYDKNGDCRVTPDELKAGNAPKQQAPGDRKGGRMR
jgi:EF hand domain-containing protein